MVTASVVLRFVRSPCADEFPFTIDHAQVGWLTAVGQGATAALQLKCMQGDSPHLTRTKLCPMVRAAMENFEKNFDTDRVFTKDRLMFPAMRGMMNGE